MAFRYTRWVVAAGAVLAWAGAACSSSSSPTGPATTPDTTAALASVLAADSTFSSSAYASFQVALGGVPVVGATSPITQAAPFLDHWRTAAVAPRALLNAPLHPTQTSLPWRSTTVTGGFIPDSLLGKTFEWDTASNVYVKTTRAGAPSNGVRFILYALANDTVAEPVSETGRLDIFDLSTATTPKVRLLVTGTTGSPVYYDNTTSDTHSGGSDSTFDIATTGFVSNGLTGGAFRKLTFGASIKLQLHGDTAIAETIADNFSLNQSGISFTGSLSVSENSADTVQAYDWQLSSTAGTLRLTLQTTYNANGRLLTAKLYSNGVVFAQLLGLNGGSIIWTDKDGNLLSASDIAVANACFTRLEIGLEFVTPFLDPGAAILGV